MSLHGTLVQNGPARYVSYIVPNPYTFIIIKIFLYILLAVTQEVI